MTATDALFVYITAPSPELAQTIARTAVEEGLAACGNILPGMHAIYRWRGHVEEAQEVVLILKTSAEMFNRLAARVREMHPYECPCIVGLPLAAGTPDYLDWICDSVFPVRF